MIKGLYNPSDRLLIKVLRYGFFAYVGSSYCVFRHVSWLCPPLNDPFGIASSRCRGMRRRGNDVPVKLLHSA